MCKAVNPAKPDSENKSERHGPNHGRCPTNTRGGTVAVARDFARSHKTSAGLVQPRCGKLAVARPRSLVMTQRRVLGYGFRFASRFLGMQTELRFSKILEDLLSLIFDACSRPAYFSTHIARPKCKLSDLTWISVSYCG